MTAYLFSRFIWAVKYEYTDCRPKSEILGNELKSKYYIKEKNYD